MVQSKWPQRRILNRTQCTNLISLSPTYHLREGRTLQNNVFMWKMWQKKNEIFQHYFFQTTRLPPTKLRDQCPKMCNTEKKEHGSGISIHSNYMENKFEIYLLSQNTHKKQCQTSIARKWYVIYESENFETRILTDPKQLARKGGDTRDELIPEEKFERRTSDKTFMRSRFNILFTRSQKIYTAVQKCATRLPRTKLRDQYPKKIATKRGVDQGLATMTRFPISLWWWLGQTTGDIDKSDSSEYSSQRPCMKTLLTLPRYRKHVTNNQPL